MVFITYYTCNSNLGFVNQAPDTPWNVLPNPGQLILSVSWKACVSQVMPLGTFQDVLAEFTHLLPPWASQDCQLKRFRMTQTIHRPTSPAKTIRSQCEVE